MSDENIWGHMGKEISVVIHAKSHMTHKEAAKSERRK